jgi:large conductance mechanosensitive channel
MTMKILTEFREFISRGSVIDLAVGVIIGAAFNKIVGALVDQVVMPPIGLATAGVNFADLKIVLKPAGVGPKTAEVAIQYGAFINTLIQFLIIAATVFLLVKGANAVRRFAAREQEQAPPPAPTPTEALLTEIRDLLRSEAGAAAAHQKESSAAKRS